MIDLFLALAAEDPKTLPLLKRCVDKDNALGKYFHISVSKLTIRIDVIESRQVQTPRLDKCQRDFFSSFD